MYKVIAWKDQLERKGLYDPDIWGIEKDYGNDRVRVSQSFSFRPAAENLYRQLSREFRIPVYRNWVS